jgi:HK97 family phage major capsid protein
MTFKNGKGAPNEGDREKKVAQLLKKMETIFDGEQGFEKTRDRVKALESAIEDFRGVDQSKISEEFEKLKAGQEEIRRAIRSSKRGMYVPGLEDEAENFSLLSVSRAVKTGDWKGLGREREVLDTVMEKHRDRIEQMRSSGMFTDATVRNTGQVVGDQARGGAFIPDQVIPDVIESIYSRSVFIAQDSDGTTRVSLADGLTGPTAKIPEFHGGMVSYWMGEEDAYATSQVKTGDVKMELHKLGCLGRMTEEMMRWGAYGFEQLFRRDMIKSMVQKLDYTCAFGRGTDHQPRGIANWNTGGHLEGEVGASGLTYGRGIKIFHAGASAGQELRSYSSAVALSTSTGFVGGELSFDQLENMRLALEEDEINLDERSTALISSPRYFSRLKTAKIDNFTGQTSNRPFLIGVPFIPDSRLRELIGDFDKMNQMRSNGAPGSGGSIEPIFSGASADQKFSGAFYGDFSEVLIGRGAGIEIMDDGGMTQFVSDGHLVKARMWVGQVVRQPRAIIFCPDVRVRD